MNPDDLDQLYAPYEIVQQAKNIIHQELNSRMSEFRINNWMMCMFPLGMIVFIGGGISSIVIFPFSFIIVLFGMCLFMGYPFYICYKNGKQSKMVSRLVNLTEHATRGIIRAEPNFTSTLDFYGHSSGNSGGNTLLKYVQFRVMESKLALYNSLQSGGFHPNNTGPVMNNMHYTQGTGQGMHPFTNQGVFNGQNVQPNPGCPMDARNQMNTNHYPN